MATTSEILKLRNIQKSFYEGQNVRQVLKDVNVEIRQGEFVALLGQSGSGKSTLLNMISAIDTPDAGQILISGHNLGDLSERDRTLFRRQHIGFVYQFFNLIPTLTVWENISLPLALNNQLDSKASIRIKVLLEQVGLWDRRQAFPDVLSGGEQQRAALVRALIHLPSLVLADEPTGNLDIQSGKQVLGMLQQLCRNRGHTMLLVTHSPSVADYADRRIVLQDGQITEFGP